MVDHSDTGNLHGHIVFRDHDESGDDFAIARDFIGTIQLRAVQLLDHAKDIDEPAELRVSTP